MQIQSPSDIRRLGTIMGVWAHPDDETFSSAGIMSVAVENGQRVVCVTATRGEAGVQDEIKWPKAELGKIREAELDKVLDILGVNEHFWLNYKDGYCSEKDKEATQIISEYIDKIKPDSILTFDENGFTGHPDHKAVYRWVLNARQLSKYKPEVYHVVQTTSQYHKYTKTIDKVADIFYNIKYPLLYDDQDCDIYFSLPIDVIKIKERALLAMPSQTEGMYNQFSEEFLRKAFSVESFIKHSY